MGFAFGSVDFHKGSLLTFKRCHIKFDVHLQDCVSNGIEIWQKRGVFLDFGSFRHKPHWKEVTVSPACLASIYWPQLFQICSDQWSFSALKPFLSSIAWRHAYLSSYSTQTLLGQG